MSRNILTGLVGAWCPSLGPSGYTLLDRSGQGNHGTLTNMDAASDWVGTPGGWALNFIDGQTPNSNHVDCGQIANRLLKMPFAVSGWAYATTYSSFSAIISADQSSPYAFSIRTGQLLTDGAGLSITTPTGLFHFAAVLAPNRREWWLNGKLTQSSTASFTVTPSASERIYIGVDNLPTATGGRFWQGHLGDIAIHNRALTGAEVGVLYRAGQGGLGRLLTQRRRRVYGITTTAVKPYLFLQRGQVIGGGML
jgi:hypothetical protein